MKKKEIKFYSKENFFSANLEGITTLDVCNLGLTELPNFPKGIESIYIKDNPIICVPELPNTTEEVFACNIGPRTTPRPYTPPGPLPEPPALPLPPEPPPIIEDEEAQNVQTKITFISLNEGLKRLYICRSAVEKLPPLPSTLNELLCNQAKMKSIPKLPPNIKKLWMEENSLSSSLVEEFPDGLEEIRLCNNPDLCILPKLPKNLKRLYVQNCGLTVFPDVAHCHQLVELYISGNNIQHNTVPEELPLSVKEFYCGGNKKMKKLPKLHSGIEQVYCSDCGLVDPPNIPSFVHEFVSLGNYFSLKDIKVEAPPISCFIVKSRGEW